MIVSDRDIDFFAKKLKISPEKTFLLIQDPDCLPGILDKISEEKFQNGNYFHPIDGFLAKIIYPRFQSYSPILPVAPQRSSYSDVSHGMYNNFYTQTYNWNLYSPVKIPNEFMDFNKNQKIKYEG